MDSVIYALIGLVGIIILLMIITTISLFIKRDKEAKHSFKMLFVYLFVFIILIWLAPKEKFDITSTDEIHNNPTVTKPKEEKNRQEKEIMKEEIEGSDNDGDSCTPILHTGPHAKYIISEREQNQNLSTEELLEIRDLLTNPIDQIIVDDDLVKIIFTGFHETKNGMEKQIRYYFEVTNKNNNEKIVITKGKSGEFILNGNLIYQGNNSVSMYEEIAECSTEPVTLIVGSDDDNNLPAYDRSIQAPIQVTIKYSDTVRDYQFEYRRN
ncbi:hypothetical protein AB1K83_13615 [Sporosarcina sp. 179-K 3D1 HS]|uniref:hypothetical protein n=1 Tax=Sporosarcina sp. 179-K 3D1 HS TaxID=3232169 RepID=UPI00399FE4EE